MGVTSKITSSVAVSAMLLFACQHKTHADTKTLSASSDSKGDHPSKAAVNGPVEVTCVTATDDSGTATPPACVIAGPGTDGAVEIGHKVAITGAGNVVLTCRGKGALTCTARIEE
jgi:hypothetical protein